MELCIKSEPNIFEQIFNKEYDKLDTNNINIDIFKNHFNLFTYSSPIIQTLNWKKFITYKFFILDNFINTTTITTEVKFIICNLFYKVQKKLFALYKFKHICLFKITNCLTEQVDLNFTPLSDMSHTHIITLLHNRKKIQFSIFDLIKIINSALSFECNFFPEPKNIKNPWDNKNISIANIYNIYFFIKNSNITLSILFYRFFKNNCCLPEFLNHNQFIIKNYIIENCHLFTNDKKLEYIHNMIRFYNKKYEDDNDKIIFGTKFPSNKIINVMEKYLKTYLLAIYSYESDIRIKNKIKLKRYLYLFKKENPYFGRKISCIQLRKLYYISRLQYEEKHIFYIFPDIYIPKPEMISLEKKCYYYDYINSNSYTIFPLFNQKKLYDKQPHLKFVGLSTIIKQITFTDKQFNIIKTKYHPIIKEIMNSVTTTPTCTIADDITTYTSDTDSIDSIETNSYTSNTMNDIMTNRDNDMNIDMENNTINDMNIESFVTSINSLNFIDDTDTIDISNNSPTFVTNYLIQQEENEQEQEQEQQEMELRIINHLYNHSDSDSEMDIDKDTDSE